MITSDRKDGRERKGEGESNKSKAMWIRKKKDEYEKEERRK